MPTIHSAGVYLIGPEHTSLIDELAGHSPVAGFLRDAFALAPRESADSVVQRASAAREAGTAYWCLVIDRGEPVGIGGITGTDSTAPDLRVCIAPDARTRGYGTLAVRMLLELAFRNLQLAGVSASIADDSEPGRRLLARFGFHEAGPSEQPFVADGGRVSRWTVDRADWMAARDRPALAALHPALRRILDAELAAGNEVAETGGGWPDDDSIFVRLRDPFRTRPSPLPADVTYTEPNDPHWWKADYSSRSPRHILAC